MKIKRIVPALLVIFTFGLLAFRVFDDTFDQLLKKMEAYNEKFPQEKVHLHLDKPYYAIGDDIWFKAYVINEQTNKPSEISHALYVELINENDSLKRQLKLPLVSGMTWGDFRLPDSLSEGNYRIRAYTQWMRNAGTEFFFDKTIKVGNSWSNQVFTEVHYSFSKQQTADQVHAKIAFRDSSGKPYAEKNVSYEVQLSFRSIEKGKALTNAQGEIEIDFLNTQPTIYKSGKIITSLAISDSQKVTKQIPVRATSATVDVQFFPESGELIEGLPCKIALKAVNAAGLGTAVSGVIRDNEGQEVNKFSSQHLGMGSFTLNPQAGKTYTATLTFKDGSERQVPLPVPQKSGYHLAVSNDTENLVTRIMISKDLIGDGEFRLLAQHQSNVYFVSKGILKKQMMITSIPKKELPAGIIQLTLFSPANIPVAERLVFVDSKMGKLDLKVATDKEIYKTREKVALHLEASQSNVPAEGSFSVSVTNNAVVHPDENNESNILTSLLLSGDLIGHIEDPNYYFLGTDDERRQDLDNLLLTQGWRRVLWKNVISNQQPIVRYQPEKALSISGTVTTYGGKPVEKGKVMLFSTSGGLFALDTLTDSQGRFNFDQLIFNDSTRFVVQARTEKDKKNVEIKLDLHPGQIVTKSKNSADIELNVNEALSAYLQKSSNFFDELNKRGLLEKSIMLKEVNIVQQKKQVKNSSNLNGAGNADAVITAEQLQNCITLSQCLQGRVAGLIIRGGMAYLVRNGNTPMQINLDGMNVGADMLDNISPFDVETIEILKSINYTTIYGSQGVGGVILITTKRGGARTGYPSFTPGIITASPKGYYTPRVFYSPAYDAEDNAGPDWRTTIFWTPHVATTDGGKAALSFYNSDQPGTYRVVVEGMDFNGNIGRAVYTYTVE